MNLGIAGKRALVTGASQGLGRAAAEAFAREGCRVAVVARREAELRSLVEAMGGAKAGHAWHAADLLAEGAPARAVEALAQEGGPFDIVVHNVGGTLQVRDPLAPAAEWSRVWRFNAGIAIEVNNAVVPAMRERGWGRIVHVSSISGESLRGSAPYAASKAFLTAYSTCLGRALAPAGIVVSALLPGAFLAEGGHWDNIRRNNPAMMADFLRHHHAIGRLGTAEEIVPFVLFMASTHVTFATGTAIPVDGGTM